MIDRIGACVFCGQTRMVKIPADAKENEENREVSADKILCDAVDYFSSSRLAEYDSDIKDLPKAEREKFFKMLDVYFGRD